VKLLSKKDCCRLAGVEAQIVSSGIFDDFDPIRGLERGNHVLARPRLN
jgi:hypothetical protein